MTQEDVIRLAGDAGFEADPKFGIWVTDGYWNDQFMRFAALVAAAEREACAEVCAEFYSVEGIAQDCAKAIRARGQE